jgi:hypothetical protein
MEATRERPSPDNATNNCEDCGADFPTSEALGRHQSLAHSDSPKENADTPSRNRPTPSDGRANNPGSRAEQSGRPGQPAPGDRPAQKGGEPRGNPERMGGESKKDGQVPYGSQPPDREGGSDEGRSAEGGKSQPGAKPQPHEQNSGRVKDASEGDRPVDNDGPAGGAKVGNSPGERSPGEGDSGGTSKGEDAPGKDKDRPKKTTDGRDDHRPAPGNQPKPY